MSGVKVFPIRMSEDFHKMLVEAAQKQGMSLHQYILTTMEKDAVKQGQKQN